MTKQEARVIDAAIDFVRAEMSIRVTARCRRHCEEYEAPDYVLGSVGSSSCDLTRPDDELCAGCLSRRLAYPDYQIGLRSRQKAKGKLIRRVEKLLATFPPADTPKPLFEAMNLPAVELPKVKP